MQMTAEQLIIFILGQLAELSKILGISYADAMAELHKRTDIDTTELDAASKEQDAPLE